MNGQTKETKEGSEMTRKTKVGIAAVAVLAAGLATLAAASANEQVAAPVPTDVRFDEKEWSITTPEGWTRKVITDSADAEKAVRYEGPNGEYFIVAIDPLGSDYATDTVWNYRVDGDGFEVVSRAADDSGAKDDRYDGILIWKSGTEPVKVGGHEYYFLFGNESATTIDAGMFEEIAESVRVA